MWKWSFEATFKTPRGETVKIGSIDSYDTDELAAFYLGQMCENGELAERGIPVNSVLVDAEYILKEVRVG